MIKVNGKFKCGQLNEMEKRRQIAKMLYGFVFAYLTHYTKVIMSFEKSRLVPGSWNHTNKISLPVERIYFYFSLLFILFMFWYEASLVEFMLWFLYGTSIFAFHFGNKCFSEKGGWLENLQINANDFIATIFMIFFLFRSSIKFDSFILNFVCQFSQKSQLNREEIVGTFIWKLFENCAQKILRNTPLIIFRFFFCCIII